VTIERLDPEADLGPIIGIERASFSVPWTEDMFRGELQNSQVSSIWILKDAGGRVVAFCCVWFVVDELHINNLAVTPDCRGQGLATELLRRVMAEAAVRGAERVTLEVRRSNLAAVNLYQKLDFLVAGVRPAYYSEPVEDALVLWRTISSKAGLDPSRPG
jgi:ribosomal-protein-alanine N-acetyltransferase